MPTSRSRAPELLLVAGALLATLALFAPWYSTDPSYPTSAIDGVRGDLSGWTVHEAMRWVALALSLIPLVLGATALRSPDAARSLAEIAMVTLVNGLGVVLYFGWLYRPGEPQQTISLAWGWWVAAGATVLALLGTLWRVQGEARRRAGAVPATA